MYIEKDIYFNLQFRCKDFCSNNNNLSPQIYSIGTIFIKRGITNVSIEWFDDSTTKFTTACYKISDVVNFFNTNTWIPINHINRKPWANSKLIHKLI